MPDKIMSILAEVTGGKSYKAHKYGQEDLDAKLATKEKMQKLSEINIRPLRIAFDYYAQRDVYIEQKQPNAV